MHLVYRLQFVNTCRLTSNLPYMIRFDMIDIRFAEISNIRSPFFEKRLFNGTTVLVATRTDFYRLLC